jgi:putative transposase
MPDRAEDVALFRYGLVREASDGRLSKAERGAMVRALAARSHPGPSGEPVVLSRTTIDRWLRAYRKGGFAALRPGPRRVEPRTPAEALELACRLRKEDPFRSAAHIAAVLRAAQGWSPHPRTLERHFRARDLSRAALTGAKVAYGRFQADHPNEIWTGDALHGPVVGGKKAVLFAYIDDCSRLVSGHRWAYSEDTLAAMAALRRGILSRGLPSVVYLDNGSPFVSRQLLRALAVLGVRLVHSRPGRPEGRGKIERFFRTVREQFLVEVGHSEIGSLEALEERFVAWLEQAYHRAEHSETGEAPAGRFCRLATSRFATPELLREAFLFSEARTVTKVATVSLFGNTYEVDPALVGRKVELVFDPFDLEHLAVRYMGRDFGPALPQRIGRHSHPMARPATEPVAPTGIDYLGLLAARHKEELGRRIGYSGLEAAK